MDQPGGSGTPKEPRPPFPVQHQDSPGAESGLSPQPRYQAEAYRPTGKLRDKVALITGGDSGIGRAVAVMFAREGAIIATSSETGIFGSKKLPDYSATKGAINAFTKALAQSLIPRGIRVNADSSYITGTVLQVMGGETSGG